MVFGKLYTSQDNSRSTPILAVAKANKLDLEIVHVDFGHITQEHLALNPLGKVPTFQGADGYNLTECIAIAIYITSQNEKTTLLGKTKQDYASILRWMSFANSELIRSFGAWGGPLRGRSPYNKKAVDDAAKEIIRTASVLEKHLATRTFLVGERITLADIFVASIASMGFNLFFDKAWRSEHPNTTRWAETIYNQPIYSAVSKHPTFVEERLKNQPPPKKDAPVKEKGPKPPATAAKPKAKAVDDDDEEEEDKPAPKPKHPLEALPKPVSFPLDELKRQYSNYETREVALPWFWEHYKAEDYSLWRVDYKYNDELTHIFMSANLIGGFFARLEASRKYIFGGASVYGKANDSVVVGAFVIRGQDAKAAFDVAPDYESYEFTKLDGSKKADREFVDDQWAWDKPVVIKGKEYEWADGKTFK